MKLNEEQQRMLDGSEGETMAKVMKTLVMYGETFGAERMVKVTSLHGHLVTSFGLSMMGAVQDLMDEADPESCPFQTVLLRRSPSDGPERPGKSTPESSLPVHVFQAEAV